MIPGTVKSIKVSGVSGQGDYDFSTGKWIHLANPSSTYDIKLNVSVNAGVITPLTDKKSALMMIPQDFGADADAKVSMVFDDGATEKTVSFKLKKTSWDAGKHITYVLSSSKITTLKMGKLTYPSGWDSVNDVATNKIRKAYDLNTSAGLFVVNEDNKVIAANVKLPLSTSSGTSLSFPTGPKLKFSPQYNYFVYYPYQANLTGSPADNTPGCDVSSSTKFFTKAIANWEIATDQSTLEKMNACDLQIGKATLDDDGCSVSFKMEHAMGLAEITLGAKTFDNNYYLSNYPSYTWKNGTTTFHAYAGISGHSFYKVADYRYVALVKPDVTTDFSCNSSTDDPDSWTENVSVKPAANGVDRVTATSKRTSWPDISYTMEVGDIYYSDGAMTHQSEDLASDKKAIGIVGYLGSDYWTEKDTKDKGIGGHALVMCLRNVDSAGSTQEALDDYEQNGFNGTKVKNYIGKTFQFLTYRTPSVRPCINSKEDIVNSFNNAKGSGYTETNVLISIYGKNAPAAFYAKSYTTLYPTSDLCTGWFLPSAGQYYAVMSNLGAPISEDWSGIAFGKNQGYFKNMTQITSNINKKMKIVGDFNYTEFFGRIAKSAWTSSENSNRYDCNAIGLFSRETTQEGAIRFVSYIGNGEGWNTDQYFHIRPFLAF